MSTVTNSTVLKPTMALGTFVPTGGLPALCHRRLLFRSTKHFKLLPRLGLSSLSQKPKILGSTLELPVYSNLSFSPYLSSWKRSCVDWRYQSNFSLPCRQQLLMCHD